jgi:hypothetical protein
MLGGLFFDWMAALCALVGLLLPLALAWWLLGRPY